VAVGDIPCRLGVRRGRRGRGFSPSVSLRAWTAGDGDIKRAGGLLLELWNGTPACAWALAPRASGGVSTLLSTMQQRSPFLWFVRMAGRVTHISSTALMEDGRISSSGTTTLTVAWRSAFFSSGQERVTACCSNLRCAPRCGCHYLTLCLCRHRCFALFLSMERGSPLCGC